MGQSTNDMFPTAIHVAVAVAIHQQLMPALSRLQAVLAEKVAGVGQDHQDRPHASGRRHAVAAWARSRRLRRGKSNFPSLGRGERRKRCSNCPRAARPSAPASTRTRNSAAALPPRWRRKPAFRSSKRPIISRPTPSATAWSNATASCERSPRRCSTCRTIFAGSARARAAGSMKSCSPTGSRAARSCRAR